MKPIFYAFLGIILYLLVGVIFWGNHYWMLPAFLMLISLISFVANRNNDLPLVKRNLFWIAIPFGTILTISGLIVNPLSLFFISTYIVGSALSLVGVYLAIYLIKRQKNIEIN